MIANLLFTLVQSTLPFQITAIWDGEVSHPATVRQEGTTFVASGGGKTARLKLESSDAEWRLTLESSQVVGISLRRDGDAHSMRFDASNDNRVVQSVVNHAFTYLSDSLYFPNEKSLYVFSGPDVKVYGEAKASGARVTFREFQRTLRIRRFGVPEQTTKRIVERVQSLLPPAQDEESLQSWIALYAWAGLRLEGAKAKQGFKRLMGQMPNAKPVSAEVLDTDTYQRSLASVPRIFVTHIKPDTGRQFAVVTLFNFESHATTERFAFGDLGLNPTLKYHVFDFWNGTHWGSAAGSLVVPLSPNGSRTFVITRDELRPSVIGESSTLFGPADSHLKATWHEATRTLTGSLMFKDNSPVFVFLSPYGDKLSYGDPKGSFTGGSGSVASGEGYVRLELHGTPGKEISFQVQFGTTTSPPEPPKPEATVAASSAWAVLIEPKRARGVAGWYVFRNDWLVGYVADGMIPDLDVDPGVPYTYTLVSVGFDGQLSPIAVFSARTPMPGDTPLTRLPLDSWAQNNSRPLLHRLESGVPATLGGAQGHALVVRDGSTLRYRVSRAFRTFSGTVGPDDSSPDGSAVTFRILADGVEIWNSNVVRKGSPVAFSVDIADAYLLELVVDPAQAGAPQNVACVWLNPHLTAK